MAVMTALALGGLALQAYGMVRGAKAAKKSGEAQQEAANSQADLADYNAAVATVQADDAIARGAQDEARFRTSVRGMLGSQRASFAANNVDVGYGSAVDVAADTAYLGELDALTIRTNAAREAWGFKVQADDLTRRGVIARKSGVMLAAEGSERAKGTYISGTGSLLTSAASLYQAKYGMKDS